MESELQALLLKKAGALLARRSFSRGEMRLKLAKVGEESQVEAVLDRLEQLNLLNDAEYAYNFALSRIMQEGWGPLKVCSALLHRQVAKATIEEAMQRVRAEVNDDSALADYLRRSCGRKGIPADLRRIRKLILLLRRRGFEDDTIFCVLRRMIPATMMRRLETGE